MAGLKCVLLRGQDVVTADHDDATLAEPDQLGKAHPIFMPTVRSSHPPATKVDGPARQAQNGV
jgi:hypothetical protein